MVERGVEEGKEVVIRQTGEIVETRESIETAMVLPEITQAYIDRVKHNIDMMQKLVETVLEEGVDWGETPGIKDPYLHEPGADKIMAAYNVYDDPLILRETITDNLIAYMIEAVLLDRRTGGVVCKGFGAASTREPKNRYRWVPDPENYDRDPNSFKKRDKRNRDNTQEYRVDNPDFEEQVNNILYMATKRAEVTATKNLPGVSSVLRKLFGKTTRVKKSSFKDFKGGLSQGGLTTDDWTAFWGESKRLGWTNEEVHQRFSGSPSGSMKSWLDKGGTLESALDLMRKEGPPGAETGGKKEPGKVGEPEGLWGGEELAPEPAKEAQKKAAMPTQKDLDAFWERTKQWGFTQAYVLECLGIQQGTRTLQQAFQEDWMRKGKTLADALQVLRGHVGTRADQLPF